MMKSIKQGPTPVDMEISVVDFGIGWPYTEYANMNQARIINGDGSTTVNTFSYVNNQPTVNSCPIISCPSIPIPSGSSAMTSFIIERHSTANTKTSAIYSTPLGEGYYRHTVTLGSSLLLSSGKQYCFMVRSQGSSGYFDYTKVGVRNGTAIPDFGMCFGADLSNYDSSTDGTALSIWYETRMSHDMVNPYYLEINGISV